MPKESKPWDNWPVNLAGRDPSGRPIGFKCAMCMDENLIGTIKNIQDIEESIYYGATSKRWFCSKHWQQIWKDEILQSIK